MKPGKSKGVSEDCTKPPPTWDNSLLSGLNNNANNAKIQVKFDGSGLKQRKNIFQQLHGGIR